MQKICLIIPCYNEEFRLDKKAFDSFLSEEKNRNIDLFFVNDGSTDDTLIILNNFSVRYSNNVQVLNLELNQGKAEAVRLGVSKAALENNYEFIGFWDADLSTPFEELIRFVEEIKSTPSVKILMGSRIRRLGAEINRKTYRHILGRIFSTCSSLILDLPVYDSQCGAKVFHKSIVRDLFNQPFITKWLFDIELLARYKMIVGRDVLLTTVQEVAIKKWQDVDGSKLKITDFIKVPFDLFKIYYDYGKI